MDFHKILWTNGKIVDLKNSQVFEYILTRNQAILTLGKLEDLTEDYDEKIDLEGGYLLSALINTYGSFIEDVKNKLKLKLDSDLLKLIESDKDKVVRAIKEVEQNYLSQGIVMTLESQMSKELIPFYSLFLKSKLNLDIIYYLQEKDQEDIFTAFKDSREWYQDNLRYGGISYNLDDKVSNKSISAKQVANNLLRLINLDEQVLVIAKSSQAQDLYIEVVDLLDKAGIEFFKTRTILISKDIKKVHLTYLNKLNHIVSNNQAVDKVDANLLFNIYNSGSKSLLENISELEKNDILSNLLSVTKSPAHLFQEEGFRGRLERCLHADFVILSHNPLTTSISKVKVLKTIKKTKLVYSKN